MFKCIYCSKEFSSKSGLAGHKGHCKEYLDSKSPTAYNEYLTRQTTHNKEVGKAAGKTRHIISVNKKQLKWASEDHYCELCGKKLPENYSDIYGSGRFCSVYCARKFSTVNNRFEINKKVSAALKGRSPSGEILLKKHCKCCGKELANYRNKSGYCKDCVKSVPERFEIRAEAGKKSAQKAKEGGKAKYWQTRDIQSYPEHFWETVLNNNSISYTGPNFPVKKADGLNNYFLDFYIEKNGNKIDLEIDGKQHKYPERAASDKVRDEYLSSLGYIVYRIEWNEINSDKGSALMKQKIDDFISFYQNIS